MTNNKKSQGSVNTLDHDFIRRIDTSIDGFRFYEGIKLIDDQEVRVWCYPSVTTKIDAVYPKDAFLIKWIREQGLGGQAIFEKAADEGTEVHIAIDEMLQGKVIPTFDMSDKVKKSIKAFLDWCEEYKPIFLESETMVVNHKYKYAGTKDARVLLDYKKGKTEHKGIYVVDYKTSNSVHDKHKIQNSSYWACGDRTDKVAILHLGNKTKAGYSFLEYDPEVYWNKATHYIKTFEMEHPNREPRIIEYPENFELPKSLQLKQ